jgi:hypothetical protein
MRSHHGGPWSLRSYPNAFKGEVVAGTLKPGVTIAFVARWPVIDAEIMFG